jgi:hypothetical protein
MRFVALFIFCLFSETAIAQTSECQSIPKANAQLACYDKVSPPIAPGKSATSKTQPASEPGKIVDPLSAENARTDAAMKTFVPAADLIAEGSDIETAVGRSFFVWGFARCYNGGRQ